MKILRGFEKVSAVELEKSYRGMAELKDVKLPKRATTLSGGYDFFSPINIVLKPNQNTIIPTGIKAYMLEDEFLFLLPRSGQGFKFFLRLANTCGIIDSDYFNNEGNEGHINIKLRNEGDKPIVIKKGDAFCQGLFQKYLLVDGDTFTGEKRIGGTGSTSK